ncbi:MAG: helix-turn-helix domain-containing protein [Clostridiales bacterium]|nr:helix-turn-helix domain-containing protein [Clostridiales bacterium]
MNEKMPFGEVLKKIRYEKRLSQEEFAKVLGTSKQVISRYENNQRIPKITTVEDYADKLHLPISYFATAEIPRGHKIAEESGLPYMTGSLKLLLEEFQHLSDDEIQALVTLIKLLKAEK